MADCFKKIYNFGSRQQVGNYKDTDCSGENVSFD